MRIWWSHIQNFARECAAYDWTYEQLKILAKAGWRPPERQVLFQPRFWRSSGEGYVVESKSSVLALLWKFRNQKCLLAKDKIWAIKSLCTELELESRLQKVGYDSPAGLMFLAIAYNILKRNRALTILDAAQLKGSKLGGIPSWTPDWTVDEDDRPSRPLTCWQKVLGQGVTTNRQERLFAVTRDSEPLFSFSPSSVFELTICGSVLANISKLDQPASYDKDPHRPA
jgi:hypothetical protein